jgi:hypothetical protein
MKFLVTFLALLLFNYCAFAQRDSVYKPTTGKFQVATSTGLAADLFYLNILGPSGFGNGEPSSYSDKKESKVTFGLISRAEVIFHATQISAFSLSFSQVSWRTLYGKSNDPLEVWKSFKRYEKRLQFAANYYRKFKLNERSNLNVGLGFMVQGQQFNNNGYTFKNGLIEFSPDYNKLFWDPALAVNFNYLYRVNKNLSLGVTLYTPYTYQIGIESASLMTNVVIDLKNLFKQDKK